MRGEVRTKVREKRNEMREGLCLFTNRNVEIIHISTSKRGSAVKAKPVEPRAGGSADRQSRLGPYPKLATGSKTMALFATRCRRTSVRMCGA